MNSLEINKALKNYKCFLGTFARDQLPTSLPKFRPLAIIMNTDPINLPGQHWVSIFVDETNCAEYFDSYGLPPLHSEILNCIGNNNIKNLSYNSMQIQGVSSNTCGHYCVLFVKLRCQNILFRDIIKLDFNDQNILNVS